VAGIPFTVDEQTLLLDFKECGPVEDIYLLRNAEGQSCGRGLVTFQDADSVEAALNLDGTEYHGRTIYVKVSTQKTEQRKKGIKEVKWTKPIKRVKVKKEKLPFPEERPEGCVSLCLKNIGESTEADVRKFLKRCNVQAVRIIMDNYGQPRGIAFVDFPEPGEVDKALKRNGKKLHGQPVEMKFEAPRLRPRPEGCMTVAVHKLPLSANEDDIWELFKGLESLSDVNVIRRRDRACLGLAFAEFTEAADVEKAVKRDGMSVRGEPVFIGYETKGKDPKKEAQKKRRRAREEGKAAADQEAQEFVLETPFSDEEDGVDKPAKGKKKARQLDSKKLATLAAGVSRFLQGGSQVIDIGGAPKKKRKLDLSRLKV